MRRFLRAFVKIHTHRIAFTLICLGFVVWIVIGQVTGLDRYPFQALTCAVSLWAILLSVATLDSVDEVHSHVDEEHER